MSIKFRPILLAAVALTVLVSVLALKPIAQDPAYHQFADQRTYLGIPHFWNVVSNLPLMLAGAMGLGRIVFGGKGGYLPSLQFVYSTFFSAALLTGIGSAYYHFDPNHWTLVWDRLPMTLLFTGFFSAVWGEHMSESTARKIFLPLAALGVASVIYWIVSEKSGQGDLRAYIVVQFLPLLLIPLILKLYPSKLYPDLYLWGVLALYLLAKVAEVLDGPIFRFTVQLSGHTLKHFIAAAGVYLYYTAMCRRRIR